MRNQATAVYRPKNGATQKVSYTGTSARTSNALGTQTRIIWVWSTTDAHVNIGGSTNTATTSDTAIPANQPIPFIVDPGQYVAAVQVSSGGDLYVNEATF